MGGTLEVVVGMSAGMVGLTWMGLMLILGLMSSRMTRQRQCTFSSR